MVVLTDPSSLGKEGLLLVRVWGAAKEFSLESFVLVPVEAASSM